MKDVLYTAGREPCELVVPELGFFVMEGAGSPDSDLFAAHVEALYAASYGVRMSYKGADAPVGWQVYKVYPLEGVWSLRDPSLYKPGYPIDRDNLTWRLMIRQPDFVTTEWLAGFLPKLIAKKKAVTALAEVRFVRESEGRVVQALHEGPYANEPATFTRMLDWCRKQSLARLGHDHREIYLTDARKTPSEKLRTILRFPVRDNFLCD